MQAWAWIEENGQMVIKAIITTTISSDVGTGAFNLVIYSMYGFVSIDDDTWKLLIDGLRKYAAELGCKKIIAYSNIQRIIDVSIASGAKSSFTLLTLEV